MVDLFTRAEKARADAITLSGQFAALRELRTLERDFRVVTRKLAAAVETIALPATPDDLRRLLDDATELLTSSGGGGLKALSPGANSA